MADTSNIRVMSAADAAAVMAIYAAGIATRNATFETTLPAWEVWDARHLPHSRFVYTNEGQVLGWVALSAVSAREAYAGVAELSVYVDPQFAGKGIGSALMERIIASSESMGIWTLFSSVFPENKATLKLHRKFGFRLIGSRERIARLDGLWRDTLLFERRSRTIGID